jgi:hypothetical protein
MITYRADVLISSAEHRDKQIEKAPPPKNFLCLSAKFVGSCRHRTHHVTTTSPHAKVDNSLNSTSQYTLRKTRESMSTRSGRQNKQHHIRCVTLPVCHRAYHNGATAFAVYTPSSALTSSSPSTNPTAPTASSIRFSLCSPRMGFTPFFKLHAVATCAMLTSSFFATSSTLSMMALSVGGADSKSLKGLLSWRKDDSFHGRASLPCARGDHGMSPMPACWQ